MAVPVLFFHGHFRESTGISIGYKNRVIAEASGTPDLMGDGTMANPFELEFPAFLPVGYDRPESGLAVLLPVEFVQ